MPDWAGLVSSAADRAAEAGSFGKGFLTGVGEGGKSLVQGLWSLGTGTVDTAGKLATDPAYREKAFAQASALAHGAADYGGQLMDDPATRSQAYEKVQALAASLKKQYDDARDEAERNGDLAGFYGRVAGRGGFEVGTFLVPAAKLGALGKAAEGAEVAKVGRATEVADALAHAPVATAVQTCKAASAMAEVVEVRSAEAVNAAMVADGRLAAWAPGTEVVTEVVPAGTRFQMVVSSGQADALMRGKAAFGGFATSEAVPSQAFARDQLAIQQAFKDDVSKLVTVETTADQVIHRGVVGAMGASGGGVQQVEFVAGKALRYVPDSLTGLPLH